MSSNNNRRRFLSALQARRRHSARSFRHCRRSKVIGVSVWIFVRRWDVITLRDVIISVVIVPQIGWIVRSIAVEQQVSCVVDYIRAAAMQLGWCRHGSGVKGRVWVLVPRRDGGGVWVGARGGRRIG